MSVLLIQSCSASKARCAAPVRALDLYTGYFYKIINKSIRDGVFRDDITLRILSAEHGLVHPDTELPYYDRRMTLERAEQLGDAVRSDIAETVTQEGIEHIVVNAASEYRAALEGIETHLDERVPVSYITGRGNGEMGSKLKALIRTDEQSRLLA